LDMRTKDILKDAISAFDGTVIVVSHDRDFLDGLVSKVYEFGGGVVKEHLGGIYDFLESKRIESLHELEVDSSRQPAPKAADAQPKASKLSYEEQKERNRQLKQAEKKVVSLESRIGELEGEIAEIEDSLAKGNGADADTYKRHAALSSELESVMAQWEEAGEQLEQMKNDN
ncbi:MAG: ABC transporter ATP-binding protein, partial [Bacteroidales bacterium]|nr:ABC transporter ATP-binding protein [Bacteroidales bacterium]